MKGGGTSKIKVGTTGKISVLMRRELESTRSESAQASAPCRRKCQTGPLSVSCRTRTQGNGQSSGGSLRSSGHGGGSQGGTHRKTRSPRLSSHHAPFLSSDEVFPHGTPNRELSGGRKGCRIVQIVDIKCGSSERGWSTPMAGRLKKLGFSRLSQTIN